MENVLNDDPQSFNRKRNLLQGFIGYRLTSNHRSMRLCCLRFYESDQKALIATILITAEQKVRDEDTYSLVRIVSLGKNSFTAEVVGKRITFRKGEKLIPEVPTLKKRSSTQGVSVTRAW